MRALLICGLFLLTAPLFAAQGTVRFVAKRGSVSIDVRPEQFTKPVNATGLVAPIARVAIVPFQKGRLAIALDADTPTGKAYTRVRLDFTGAGKFSADYSLEMQQTQKDFCLFIPKDVSLNIGSRTFPVNIDGYLKGPNNQPNLSLYLGTEAQANCAFGDKTYTVHMIDANGNLHFGDPIPIMTFHVSGFPPTGDYVMVDDGDHHDRMLATGAYGQPIAVDGHWYNIAITPDESTMSVTPFTGPTGMVFLKIKHWFGVFVGAKYMVYMEGNGQQQSIPVDNYHIIQFQEMPDDPSGTPPLVISDLAGKGKLFAVKANAVTRIDMGSSITARVLVQQDGRNLTFMFSAATSTGLPLILQGNKVQFVVKDKQGNKVYENTFESSQWDYFSCSWRAPKNLHGIFTAHTILKTAVGMPVTCAETKITLP